MIFHEYFFTFNNVLVTLRTAFFLRSGVYIVFSFEPQDGFDPQIAQTKGLVKGEKCAQSLTRTVNDWYCASIFYDFYTIMANSAVRQTIRAHFRILANISATTEQGISRTNKDFCLSHRRIKSAQRFINKGDMNSRFLKIPPFLISPKHCFFRQEDNYIMPNFSFSGGT